jgi:hypothetical protein
VSTGIGAPDEPQSEAIIKRRFPTIRNITPSAASRILRGRPH